MAAGYVVDLITMQPLHITPQLLKEIRAKLGITQPEAAARCRVSVRTWAGWEGGETKIDGPASIVIEMMHAEANRRAAAV